MKIIEHGVYTLIPTKEIEVSQKKRVYEMFLDNEFIGYRVKVPALALIKGVEKKKGFRFAKCEKAYQDEKGNMKFIIC